MLFDVGAFERAVVGARLKLLSAAVFLVGFQVFIWDAVVVKPILRDFFGVGA